MAKQITYRFCDKRMFVIINFKLGYLFEFLVTRLAFCGGLCSGFSCKSLLILEFVSANSLTKDSPLIPLNALNFYCHGYFVSLLYLEFSHFRFSLFTCSYYFSI